MRAAGRCENSVGVCEALAFVFTVASKLFNRESKSRERPQSAARRLSGKATSRAREFPTTSTTSTNFQSKQTLSNLSN